MKIVINVCYGGFGLSEEAMKFLKMPTEFDPLGPKFGFSPHKYVDYAGRTDPELIKCIETLGDKASGPMAKLKIVDIPDGINWEITEYDGWETIEEKHRKWN